MTPLITITHPRDFFIRQSIQTEDDDYYYYSRQLAMREERVDAE
jgi:hypothetical protein